MQASRAFRAGYVRLARSGELEERARRLDALLGKGSVGAACRGGETIRRG